MVPAATRIFNPRDLNRPISVYRLGEIPIRGCGQSVSAPRGKAGARLNAHTEFRAKRQRLAREAIYRNWLIELSVGSGIENMVSDPVRPFRPVRLGNSTYRPAVSPTWSRSLSK